MPRLKVAIVHNTIAPYRHPLFEKLFQKLDSIVYYCSAKSGSRSWDLWPRNYDYKYEILPKISFGEISVNPSIVKELALNRPYVLVLGGYVDPTMWLAFAVGKLLKIPIVYWTEGVKEPRSILGIITKPIRYLFAKKSDACIAQGNRTKNYLESLGVDGAKIFIAHNCVDNELFIRLSQKFKNNKDILKKHLGFHEKHLLIFVGRLTPMKGVFDLIEIYKKVIRNKIDIGLIIVGSGPLKDYLRNTILKDNLNNVHIIGSVTIFRELVKYYSISDLFVLPTLTDLAPLVLNEAMACGLPVVVYNAAGNVDDLIVPQVNGIIVDTGDIEGFSESIIKIVSNQNVKAKMSKEARRIITLVAGVESAVSGFLGAIKNAISCVK